MKTTTDKRLKEIMTRYGLRQVDILKRAEPYCKQYGIKLGRNDLSQYVSGKVSPGQEKLTVLALALGISETWLMGYDVPLERNNYEDPTVSRFDTELDDARDILENVGYTLYFSDDDSIIIKNKSGKIIACLQDYELVSKYESLQKKGIVTAELLLKDSKQAFLTYLDSLGYHLYRDDPEHRPFMSTKDFNCRLDYDTLDSLKSRIDSYARATIDAELLALHAAEIRQESLEKERLVQHLLNEAQAAHERTDIEVTAEMHKADDDIMNDDNF